MQLPERMRIGAQNRPWKVALSHRAPSALFLDGQCSPPASIPVRTGDSWNSGGGCGYPDADRATPHSWMRCSRSSDSWSVLLVEAADDGGGSVTSQTMTHTQLITLGDHDSGVLWLFRGWLWNALCGCHDLLKMVNKVFTRDMAVEETAELTGRGRNFMDLTDRGLM